MTYGDDEILDFIKDNYTLGEIAEILSYNNAVLVDDLVETYETELLSDCREYLENEMEIVFGDTYDTE